MATNQFGYTSPTASYFDKPVSTAAPNQYGYVAPTPSYDLSGAANPSTNMDWLSVVMKNPIVKPKAEAPKKEALWRSILGSLTAGGSVITDSLYSGVDMVKKDVNKIKSGDYGWKDIFGLNKTLNDVPTSTLSKVLADQAGSWFDGSSFSYDKIPLLGTLNMISQQSKHGADILKDHFGASDSGARWGGLGIDIVADPLTWLTGGASGAMKTAGQTAALNTAKGLGVGVEKTAGKALGFIPKKSWDIGSIADQVGEAMAKRTAAKFGGLEPAASTLKNTTNTYRKMVLDAVDVARGSKQNALFSAGLPFGAKIALGEKAPWLRNLARTSEKKIGKVGGAQATAIMDHLGLTAAEQRGLLKSKYGVNSAEQLTEEAFKRLSDDLSQYTHTADNIDDALGRTMQAERINWGKIGSDPNVDLGAAPFMEQFAKPLEATKSSEVYQNLLNGIKRYSQGEVAKRSVLPAIFNPRTLGTGDHFVDSSANAVRDASTKVSGQTQQLAREEQAIGKFIEKNNITEQELREVQHALENKVPKGFAETTDVQRADTLADLGLMLKKVLDRVGQQGMESGVLNKLRENYFPHVMKKDVPTGAKNPLAGLSGVSGFSKERQSFDTLADLDNYVSSMKKAAEKAKAAGNADEAAKLRQQADEVANLFERDTVEAVFSRAREGIKKSAMKELNTKLKDKGLILKKADANPAHHKAAEYVALDAKQAKSMGMTTGDFVHKDVLKGLERIDELFTYDKLTETFDNIQSITNIWKSLVTTAVPSHFWNNFIGNIFNNALAGVRARDYKAAQELIKGFKKGALDAKGEKLMQEAIDYGAFGQGFTADFRRFAAENAKDGKLVKTERATRKFMDKMPWAKAGLYGENVTRLANFLHGKATLGSAEKASQQVRTYLFSYQEMTKGDKMARVAVPFWNWTKNNLPLQFEQLFKNTRVYQTFARIKEDWDESTGADNPAWGKDRYWKIPGTEMGIPLNLPSNDMEMISGNPIETTRKFLGSMTPLGKVPVELALNKQFFTNKPIDWKASPNGGNVGAEKALEYLLNQTGGVNKGIDALNSESGDELWRNLLGLITGKPYNYQK